MEYNIFYIMPKENKVYELTSNTLLGFELNIQEYLDNANTVEFDLETFIDEEFLTNNLESMGFKLDTTNPDSVNKVYYTMH